MVRGGLIGPLSGALSDVGVRRHVWWLAALPFTQVDCPGPRQVETRR